MPDPIASELLSYIDWERPDFKRTALRAAYDSGDHHNAALGFIRHLRARKKPNIGYTPAYVRQLRRCASVEARDNARRVINSLLPVTFAGGAGASDGRGTLPSAVPEVLQIAGTADDFLAYAQSVAGAHERWKSTAMHSVMWTARYLQAIWSIEECPDGAIIAPLTFLIRKTGIEWGYAKDWAENMLGTNGHNWWVAQMGATFKVGLLFPEFVGLARFAALAPSFFERAIHRLIYTDGFTREASVSYHTGTSDLFLDATRIGQANGIRFSKKYLDLLRKMYEVEWKLMCPDGGHPPFGDCWSMGPYLLNRSRSIAALIKIPEAKALAELLDKKWGSPFAPMLIENLHYPSVGENLMPAYRRLKGRLPAALDCALTASGYYAMRSGWDANADYLAIEASVKGPVITSHGHSAVFDLCLYAKGRAILVGNAKGPESSTHPARWWRVGSAAHNVTTVDEQDHALIREIYRFKQTLLPTVDEWVSEKTHAYFSGVHEAYERLENKVTASWRKIFFLRGQYWIMLDRFTTAQREHAHVYTQHFQVGVPVEARPDGTAVTRGEGGNLLFVPLSLGANRMKTAVADHPFPLEDYANPMQLSFRYEATGSTLLGMIMVPFVGDAVPDVRAIPIPVTMDERQLSAWVATALEVTIDGRRDLYVDQHMEWHMPWSAGGTRGEGRLFHSRCHAAPKR